jgi:hypothetical protein
MPEKPVPVWRKIAEGVAAKLIVVGIVSAGGAVMTWYTAHSAYFSGRPFYEVAPYIAGVACLCFITLYYSWLWIERLQTYLTEHRLAWLNKTVEGDRLRIDKAVPVVECSFSRAAGAPGQTYIEFMFDLFNGSVYSVAIDKSLKGFVRFGDIPLQGRVAITGRSKLDLLEPRQTGTFVVTLWMSQEDSETIDEIRKVSSNAVFAFDQLSITVAGANENDNVIAQPLDMANVRVGHP